MSGLLFCLLFVFGLLLLMAALALVTPVRLGFTVHTAPTWRLKIAARLLGGLTPPISLHDSASPGRKKKKPAAKRKQRSRGERPARPRLLRAIAAAPRLLADLLRPIRLRRLSVDADVGLADPADTGQLFGWLAALNYSRPPSPHMSIAIRPDFSGPRVSGELDAELSFIPVAFVPPGFRFAWRVFGSRR